MQSDDVIWGVIGTKFCCYKVKMAVQSFCRNAYNVTGLCSRQNCPLANSQYATVRERDGVLYLYMKTVERAHSPANLWERVPLKRDFAKALAQIDSELQWWDANLINKCKQRFTKLTQVMIRKKRAQFATTPLVVPINQKRERREASREVKALRAARLEQSIEKELLDRLRKGIYDTEETDGIVNADASAFSKALDQIEDELEEEQEVDEQEDYEALVAAADHSDTEADREYVSDMSASEGEEDDFEDWNVVQEEAGGLSSDSDSDSSDDGEAPAAPLKSALKSAKRPPKKQVKRANQKLEIEYEYENAANEVQQR